MRSSEHPHHTHTTSQPNLLGCNGERIIFAASDTLGRSMEGRIGAGLLEHLWTATPPQKATMVFSEVFAFLAGDHVPGVVFMVVRTNWRIRFRESPHD
mmetsp:Transcript_4195/g.10933  ORF Transcript_4195/g.10933 Transcript_4195/m.10933 type:complete len:98 (+) Transcript_4195:1119-1412(+)